MSKPRHSQYLETVAVELPILEDRPTEDGYGTMAVATGMQTYKVQIYFDPTDLRALAFKAARNKSGQSIIGPLKAIVTEPRK